MSFSVGSRVMVFDPSKGPVWHLRVGTVWCGHPSIRSAAARRFTLGRVPVMYDDLDHMGAPVVAWWHPSILRHAGDRAVRQTTHQHAPAERSGGDAAAAWSRDARHAVLRAARACPGGFIGDDVWDPQIGSLRPHPSGDDRALGPVISQLKREGLLVHTGESRQSTRSNGSRKPVLALAHGVAA